jgi:hypothetical protein
MFLSNTKKAKVSHCKLLCKINSQKFQTLQKKDNGGKPTIRRKKNPTGMDGWMDG